MKTVFDLLKIQTVEDDLVLNNLNQRFALFEVEGLPCYFHDVDLSSSKVFLNREGRDGTVMEFFCFSLLKDERLEERFSEEKNPIVAQRLSHLRALKCKKVRKIVSISSDRTSRSAPTVPPDIGYYQNVLSAFGLESRRLSTHEIKLFLYEVLSMNGNLRISKDMSVREQLIQSQMGFQPDCMKIGPYHLKVLSCKHLPEKTSAFQLSYILDFILNEYLFSCSFWIGDQTKERAGLNLKKRFALSSMYREKHLPNEAAQIRFNEATELSALIAAEGHKIGLLSMKVILWDKTKAGLSGKTEWLIDKLKSAGFYFYEEYLGHDLEFFKSLPAHTILSNRAHRVLAGNFVEVLPLSKTSKGDIGEANPLFMRNRFGELYAFDPFGSTRNNWNSMVLGASGSGKSVTMNMLIAHAMYPRIAAEGGKIFIVDFAGAEKSSYLKMAKLFGGKFLPIDASGAISINPFPPRDEVLLGRGSEGEPVRWNTTTLTFLNIVLDLILANRGEGMESDIFRGIISRAIMEMYQKVERPTLKDVLAFIRDEDSEKEAILKKLLSGFLGSPESKLVSGQGTISYGNEPFVIFDLQGISSLPPKLQELVTFIVVEEARKAAFRTSGCKFVIFDEVAQLIKDARMVSLIDEMYSTARKHRSSIWTITQNFLSYKESALSSKIKINTTTTFFLSHAADEEAKRLVAADFGFSELEKAAFAGLHTKKGEYSLALIRTITNRGEDAEVVRIELSPLDYWLATSDDRDNERLSEIMRERNCSIIEACYHAARPRRPDGESTLPSATEVRT